MAQPQYTGRFGGNTAGQDARCVGAGANVTEKAAEIPSQLASLTDNIGFLENAVADLEARLQPYAGLDRPEAEAEPTSCCDTSVGETIRAQAARVASATYRLQSLYRRLEV